MNHLPSVLCLIATSCLVTVGCKRPGSQSQIREAGNVANSAGQTPAAEPTDGKLATTVHGAPVNAKLEALKSITEEQLATFLQSIPAGPEEISRAPVPPGSTEYIESCRAEGVPIPPAWNSGLWKLAGALPKNRIFALNSQLVTELFYYQDAAGVCAALPRSAGGVSSTGQGGLEALGIICQGNNGRACFWDNVDVVSQRKIRDLNKIAPQNISDATNLRENCTECHRGSNVFIVHVDTPLAILSKQEIRERYLPLSGSRSAWKNPKILQQPGQPRFADNCQSCHELPALSAAYCSTVLLPSLYGNTGQLVRSAMPPAGEDPNAYKQDLLQIQEACGKFISP